MEKPVASVGVVSSDPSLAMDIGSQIQLKSVQITFSGEARFAALMDWTSFNGVLLSICLTDQTAHRIVGSAVLVAPGIALYAHHVVEPILGALMAGDQAINCFGIAPSGLMIWKVLRLTRVKGTDLGIMVLELASEFRSGDPLHFSSITTRLPKEGDELLVCGFRAGEPSFPREEGKFSGRVVVSNGIVTKRYPIRRDSAMAPWPCLEVSCKSLSGMSGGPAFDSTGRLVGLLSSSVGDSQVGEPSFVSLTWPALGVKFEGGWPSGAFKRPSMLIELHHGACDIDRREVIQSRIDPTTGEPITDYHWWE